MRQGARGLLALFAGSLLTGALPPRSDDDLASSATHIVVGEVTQVFSRVEEVGPGAENRIFLLEVKVVEVAKGEGFQPGKVLYARTWQTSKRPMGWAGPQGQNAIPPPGEKVRLFLRQSDDGGLDIVVPNGIAPVPAPK